MKKFRHSILVLLSVFISIYSCKDENKSLKNTDMQVESNDSLDAIKQNAIIDFYKNASPNSTASIYHYTCPKGCSGGAASAVACSNCGTTLVHNAAYHNNSNTDDSFSNSLNATPAAPKNSNPSNTSSVFHYICENGCAGGSASAGDCSTCGNKLVHNAAYHN